MGGGAVGLASGLQIIGGDTIVDLIDLWRAVRDKPTRLCREFEKLPVSADVYYAMRAESPSSSFDRALRFLYLNRACYGGVYRVNRSGQFNVPFGFRYDRDFFDTSRIVAAHRQLRRASLECLDFRLTFEAVEHGDFLFVDPPYVMPEKSEQGFRRFSSSPFTLSEMDEVVAGTIEAGERASAAMLCLGAATADPQHDDLLTNAGWAILLERKHRSGHLEQVWVSPGRIIDTRVKKHVRTYEQR